MSVLLTLLEGQLVFTHHFRKQNTRDGESKFNVVTSRLVAQVVDCDMVQTKTLHSHIIVEPC